MNNPERRPDQRPGQDKKLQRRLLLTLGLFVALMLANVIKLFDTSVINYREISEKATAQHMRRKISYPMRGNILDSQGKILASTSYVYTVGFTPADVRSRTDKQKLSEIVSTVATILDYDVKELAAQVKKTDAPYIQLKKNVPRETKEALEDYLKENSIGGFAIDPIMQRIYPENNFASGVIGFTNRIEDNIQGIMGIERSYDKELTGQPGYEYAEVDNYLGTRLPNTDSVKVDVINGYHVKLNIKSHIQNICQEVVDALALGFDAKKGAFAVVLDARTGAVWAMADNHSFDLNNPAGPPQGIHPDDWNPGENQDDIDYLTSSVWVNQTTMFPYEPGSTFKPFTSSMALDEQVVGLEEYLSDAPVWVGDWTEYPISCWAEDYGFNHGAVTLGDAIMHSCNPPFVHLALRLGIDRFYGYADLMGLNEPTGIDLPAESVGLIHSDPNVVDMATLAIGEQSTVTGIRLAQLYAALANDGNLVTPRVADALLDDQGNVVRQFKPEIQRRVFSAETTRLVRERMINGTHIGGSGPDIYFPGHLSAGKTGTSLAPYGSEEDASTYTVATITPYDDPHFIVVTSLQVPRNHENSLALQKANRYITRKVMEEMKYEPRWIEYDWVQAWRQEMLPAYNYNFTFFDALVDLTRERNVQVRFPKGIRGDDLVTQMWPPAGSILNADGFVFLGTEDHPLPENLTAPTTVPDFRGLGLFEMRQLADEMQLNVNYLGYNPGGRVVSQSVDPGSSVSKWSVISLSFSDEAPEDRTIIEYQKKKIQQTLDEQPMTAPLPGEAYPWSEGEPTQTGDDAPGLEETVPYNEEGLPEREQSTEDSMIPAGGHGGPGESTAAQNNQAGTPEGGQ